jgi:hypothetical protein
VPPRIQTGPALYRRHGTSRFASPCLTSPRLAGAE